MPAYSEMYLVDAMENMGEMADFVFRILQMDLDEYWALFAMSSVAGEFAKGSPRVTTGRTGAELAVEVCSEAGLALDLAAACECLRKDTGLCTGLTPAYWCGWILAFYQWHCGLSFKRIHEALDFDFLMKAYPTMHEADEMRFCVEADKKVFANGTFGLRRARAAAGLSQSQLAAASGVGIRAIQQYEQGAKDIRKAAAGSVAALARTLHCSADELLEQQPSYEYAYIKLPF